MTQKKIKIGVSSCLLGEKVRHDGGSKKQNFITDVLSHYFEFIPTCPEVDIGLGVPRPTIHLIKDPKSPRLVFTKDHSRDITEKMTRYSKKRCKQLNDVCGYIFKKNSPTCGPDVKVYQNVPKPPKMGKGIFFNTFCEQYPLIPVLDEGRLNDPMLRENLIERIYLFSRWQGMVSSGVTAKKLVDFHTRHKLALMAHNVSAYKRLGQLIAQLDKKFIKPQAENYIHELMQAFKLMASNKKVSNVLYHCLGYLKKDITAKDKHELTNQIEQYRQGKLPVIVPITLLKHHFMHYPNDYMAQQTFLNPYPDELMLRNRI